MTVRLKRLQADYNKIVEAFSREGKIRIKSVQGNPPEKYQVEYLVQSLVMRPEGGVQVKSTHLVEVYLTRSYPRQAPQCYMLTPVFHPNIAPHAICIGDHWAAGESLLHLLVRIGEMLAFQSYNLKSPLNGEAARWVDQNRQRLPLDSTDFSAYLEIGEKILSERQVSDITLTSTVTCINCGTHVTGAESVVCASKHVVCRDCQMRCAACGRQLCLKCLSSQCQVCRQVVCAQCHFKCQGCRIDLCAAHVKTCHVCGAACCPDCSIDCQACGKIACLDHMEAAADQTGHLCSKCAPRPEKEI